MAARDVAAFDHALESLVCAQFILPENRNLVPSLFTRVPAHFTYKQLLGREGDGDPLGRPVRQTPRAANIAESATSIAPLEDELQAAFAAHYSRGAKNGPSCRKIKVICAAGAERKESSDAWSA
jgi:hypothetical protein